MIRSGIIKGSGPCARLGGLLLSRDLRFASSVAADRLKRCCQILNVPMNSNQDTVRKAFLELAKLYHPDSGHESASFDKFCEIEDAFRELTKKNTGSTVDVESVVEFDIQHTAPQHRQYLSYGGAGHGTPSQRERQYAQARAQKAAENVMEHRVSRAMATDNTLIKKADSGKGHDIKTKYGFDRLVEDLIQEAMSKGEFDNLKGKGKPLKGQNYNPYVDFTTHKINEMLINNGFTPEWITLNKEIRDEISQLREQLTKERAKLSALPLTEEDAARWKIVCDGQRDFTKKINSKITSFNLIVPLLNKQMFLLKFDEIADDILKNGQFDPDVKMQPNKSVTKEVNSGDEILMELVKTVSYIFSSISSVLRREKSGKFKE